MSILRETLEGACERLEGYGAITTYERAVLAGEHTEIYDKLKIAISALNAIANINTSDCAKYVAQADDIAMIALAKLEA